ncbi:vesicle-associated membrane protein 3-like [Tachysurus ichikawai]
MLDNLNKAEERKEKLEDLDERATVLLNKSQSFQKQTKKVKQKKRKEYLKSKAGLIALMAVLALVIIVILAIMFSSERSGDISVQRAAVTSKPNITEQL